MKNNKHYELLRHNIKVTPEVNKTKDGWFIQINRNGDIVQSSRTYKDKRSLNNAIQKAIDYEYNKL